MAVSLAGVSGGLPDMAVSLAGMSGGFPDMAVSLAGVYGKDRGAWEAADQVRGLRLALP
jgi:hypothetical protein